MDKLRIIETNVFLSLIIIMILAVLYIKHKNRSLSTQLYLALCWSTLIVLILDMSTWLTDGIAGEHRQWLPFITNYILFLVQPVPLIIWLYYVDFMLNKSVELLKKRWFYLIPFLATLIIMIYSAFTDYVFYIDEANRYQRGPGMALITVLYVSIIVYSFTFAVRHRHTADRKVLNVVILFGVIPIAGSVFQLLYYGGPVIWPCVAIAVIYVYIFLQTQREIRDYLTGLLNRQQIDDIIQIRIRDHGKKGNFGLIMIDMDGFKKINDQYGHNQGDEALIQLSSILSSSIKTVDKAARFGGDEFLILIETADPEKIEQIINRIQTRIATVNAKKKKPYNLSISAGYTIYSPEKYSGFIHLLNDVDQKMYAVKKRRRAG